ncbi:SDR family oxidoreductase [Jatrophihabitans sp. DSM 45814]
MLDSTHLTDETNLTANALAEQLDERARNRLRGKIGVVTGAGQGIGRAVARRFAAEGATVVVWDRSEEGSARTVSELTEHGAPVRALIGDLTDYDSVSRLVKETVELEGRIDILANIVGGATNFKPFVEWEMDEILVEMNRSLLPALFCCRAVLPHMIERRDGRIVNTGAESVRNGLWDRAPYNIGKGGVHALTTSIARELAETGITCNAVAPGGTNSQPDRVVPRYSSMTEADQQARERLRDRVLTTIPMGRRAEPEEQAAAVAFLASDDASFITGQILSVNGGSSMI